MTASTPRAAADYLASSLWGSRRNSKGEALRVLIDHARATSAPGDFTALADCVEHRAEALTFAQALIDDLAAHDCIDVADRQAYLDRLRGDGEIEHMNAGDLTPAGPGCSACGLGGLVCSAHPDRPPAPTTSRPDACGCGAEMTRCPDGCALLGGPRIMDLLNRAIATPVIEVASDWSGVVRANRERALEVATDAIGRDTTRSFAEQAASDVLDDLVSAGFRLVEGWLPGSPRWPDDSAFPRATGPDDEARP